MDLSRDEQSCLLYLETCMVDQHGRCEGVRMNAADQEAVKKFVEQGLLEFGRIPLKEIPRPDGRVQNTNWVKFNDGAWELAHKLRRQRADRNYRGKHHEMHPKRQAA